MQKTWHDDRLFFVAITMARVPTMFLRFLQLILHFSSNVCATTTFFPLSGERNTSTPPMPGEKIASPHAMIFV